MIMAHTSINTEKALRKAIENAIKKAIENGQLTDAPIPAFVIEEPADRSHGDLATNAAMVGAKAFRMPPFKIAQAITEYIDLSDTLVERLETAGPGFINFFLSKQYFAEVVKDVLNEG